MNIQSQSSHSRRFCRQAGMALVITLALLVLVTIATMALFSRATANRSVESSRSNLVLAQQMVQTGVDYTVARCLQMMKDNANTLTENGVIILQVTDPEGMVPNRALSTGISSSDAANLFPSLVQQSVPSADPRASSDNVATPSQNGRSVPIARWNAPVLNLGAGFASTNQLPNWVYVNRDGTVTNTSSGDAIGRFAYNVYDIGGLLDANVAGNPGLTGPNLQAIKDTLAGADLSLIPGIGSTANAALFVNWRNPGLAGSTYVTAVTDSAEEGFRTFSRKAFTSRQDLIRFARDASNGVSSDALPYLTHSSISLIAPSWGPTTNAVGAAYQYKDSANLPTATNRFLPNVRVKGSFTRRDGTEARVGEPLINSRFPLEKLAWLGTNGPVAPGTTSTIQRDFGLVWDGSNKRWNYAGPTGATVQNEIMTLEAVANGNREPNFFELLKAGILSGSLGQGSADDNGTIGMFWHPAYSRSVTNNSGRQSRLSDYQIMQIGVNLVDQQDADDIPTAISFDSGLPTGPFVGVENLPYIYKLFTRIFRPEGGYDLAGEDGPGEPQPAYRPFVRGWLVPEIWNPNGNADLAPARPMRIVQTAGSMRIFTKDRRNEAGATIPGTSPYSGGSRFSLPAATAAQNQFVSFTSGPTYASPRVLSGTANSVGEGNFSGSGLEWSGFWLGDINDPDSSISGTSAAMLLEFAGFPDFDPSKPNDWITTRSRYGVGPSFDTNVVIELEVDAGGGDWRTVQRLEGPNAQSSAGSFYFFDWQGLNFTETDRVTVTSGSHALVYSDPRTQRFGMSVMDNLFQTRTSGTRFLGTLRSPFCLDRNDVNPSVNGRFLRVPAAVPNAAPNSGTWTEASFSLAALVENVENSSARVGDPDGVLRNGDGRLATSAGFDALGDGANAVAARPYILNRPFRSPGEMGYAFRDQPWKTLDLFSAESADSALLDLFCVGESTTPISAGVVNLNAASSVVLQSLLVNSTTGNAGAELLDTAASLTLANALRGELLTTPLVHPGELAAASAALPNATFPSARDATIKSNREVVVRSLAPMGQTRTWNLMIDVIAQSGRFQDSSAPTAETFIVESESRAWVTGSLDRFLGRPVSLQYENVPQ